MKLYRIRKSKIDNKGRGLYATKDIKEGTRIINYKGKIITNKQVDESKKFDNGKPIYLFTLNKRYTLDGDFPWNTAGLINHSCDPNAQYDGKGLKIWITAIKDIKKGDKFTKENLWVKRPGTGEILAEEYNNILGKTASEDILNDNHLNWANIKK